MTNLHPRIRLKFTDMGATQIAALKVEKGDSDD